MFDFIPKLMKNSNNLIIGILVLMLMVSDLIYVLTGIIVTFGFYSDIFITFDRSNWRINRDAMDGTHPKVL